MSGASLALPRQVDALYADHHGWLQAWLGQKLGNAFDAADLAHDTFVRVLRKVDDEPIREPRAYLVTIAGALVSSHWRRQALERAWLESLATLPVELVPSPEDAQLILEALEAVSEVIAGLPRQVRECLLLSQLEGLTYPQIAQRLGLTVNVVQKAMTRALTHCYRARYAS